LFNWQTVDTNLDFQVSAVQALMVLAAKRLQLAEPECFHVAVMVLAVVDDVGYDGAAFGFADLAQWMCHEMVAPALALYGPPRLAEP